MRSTIVAFGDEEGVRFPTTHDRLARARRARARRRARQEGRRRNHAQGGADEVRRRSRAALRIARARHRGLRRTAYRAGAGAGGRGPGARNRRRDQRRHAARRDRARPRGPRRRRADGLAAGRAGGSLRNDPGDRGARAQASPTSSPPSGASTRSRARSTSFPALVRFSVDIRSPRDEWRRRAVSDIADRAAGDRGPAEDRSRRSRRPTMRKPMSAIPASSPGSMRPWSRVGQKPFHLPSGAGHDTMVMGQICPAGMLFVRCKGGVSHNPAESITRRGLRARARGADPVRQGLSRLDRAGSPANWQI